MSKILNKIPQQQNSHSIISFIRLIVVLVCVLVFLSLIHESNFLRIESMYLRAVIMLVAFLTVIIALAKYPIKSLSQSDEDTQIQHLSTAQKRSRKLKASNIYWYWLMAILIVLLCFESALTTFSTTTTQADVLSTDSYHKRGETRYSVKYRFYDAKSGKWYSSWAEISQNTWEKLDTAEIKWLPVRYFTLIPSISSAYENNVNRLFLWVCFVLCMICSVANALSNRRGLRHKQSNNLNSRNTARRR